MDFKKNFIGRQFREPTPIIPFEVMGRVDKFLEVKPSPVDWQLQAQTGVNDLFLCSELATGTLCNYRFTGRCTVFQEK